MLGFKFWRSLEILNFLTGTPHAHFTLDSTNSVAGPSGKGLIDDVHLGLLLFIHSYVYYFVRVGFRAQL